MSREKISATERAKVLEATKLRFRDSEKFKCPEVLVMFEQGILDEKEAFEYCLSKYRPNFEIEQVKRAYVSRDMIDQFLNSPFVPLYIDNIKREYHVAVIPEFGKRKLPLLSTDYDIKIHYVDMIWYVDNYATIFGQPQFLVDLPIYDILGFIVEEAITYKVIDTTISSGPTHGRVYHNVNTDTVESKRRISNYHVIELLRLLASFARDSLDITNRKTRRFSVQLNEHYRARVEATPTYYGFMITMRLLPNAFFSYVLSDIHLDEKVIEFIRKYCQDLTKPGARIVSGPTGSGKNTTIFSSLTEVMTRRRKIKCISLEQPVELLLENCEQMDALTDDLFENYAQSTIRHNPDLLYFSEITDRTAREFMKIANTGKVVYATIHTNSAATIVSRLVDLTGLSVDRVIQDIHCVIYQRLLRDEDYGVKPVNTCIYFSEALRKRCIGKDLGEVMLMLYEAEDRWRVTSLDQIRNGALDI